MPPVFRIGIWAARIAMVLVVWAGFAFSSNPETPTGTESPHGTLLPE